MDDLRQRFATLDHVPVPDVWNDVELRLEALGTKASTGRLLVVKPAWRGTARDETPLGSATTPSRRHSLVLLAAAALITALLVGGALAVGSGLIRLTSVVPPLPNAPFSTTPSPASTAPGTSPTPVPSPSLVGPLGGDVIVAHDWEGAFDHGPYDVYALDAATGERTSLGTLPGGRSASGYSFQRDAEAQHVLIVSGIGSVNGTISNLESPTDTSRTLGFIASRDVSWINGDAGSGNVNGDYGEGYQLSPRGDRVATVHVDNPIEILVLDVGGSGVQKIPIRAGVEGAFIRAWSPDQSAVLVAGCRPCNKAESPTERQTADHSHLYVVPLDGSPWRELLDVNNADLDATWSPDGSTLAVTHGACLPGQHMPRCPPGQDTISLLGVGGGAEKHMTTLTERATWPVWSPDSRRIAYVGGRAGEILKDGGIYVANADGTGAVKVADTSAAVPPVWSPDGLWLLYRKDEQTNDWWLVSVDGGETRRLGTYGGVTW